MDFLFKIRKQLANISMQDDIQRYCTRTYAKINELRNDKKLCDVILKVEDHEFPAHKIVLAASSDFFSAMFSSGMSESAQPVIELKSISLNIINEILEYIYTGNVLVTNENVQELLPAANLTQLLGLKRACCVFLMRHIEPANVLGVRRFAEVHDCAVLERFARKYAAHNLEAVLRRSDEFVQLIRSELIQLIRMTDLNVYSEESVYKAVLQWVHFSRETRARWLPHLLRKVRLSQLSIRFITDVVSVEPLIKESLACRDLLDEAKLYHLRPDARATLMRRADHPRFRPRSDSAGGGHFLVLVGGFGCDQAPISSVEIFDPRTQKWGVLPNLPGRYRYVAACSVASCIYVIGGFDGRERLNTVSVLDVGNQVQGWLELAPMHFRRGLAATCVHNGLIYVCGGFDGMARLKSLEVFEPARNAWQRKACMNTSREGAGLVEVDGSLYCIGGYNGMQLLDTVERYEVDTDSWSGSEPMHYRRSGAGCAVMHECIYVCGGYGGAQRQGPQHLDSVECFNTLSQQWSFVASMREPRCYIGACQMDNMIWVAAGYDGNRLLGTVEAYDRYGVRGAGTGNCWTTLKTCPMRQERCDTGMCIVRLFQLSEPRESAGGSWDRSGGCWESGVTGADGEEADKPGLPPEQLLSTGVDDDQTGMYVAQAPLQLPPPYNSQSGQPVPAQPAGAAGAVGGGGQALMEMSYHPHQNPHPTPGQMRDEEVEGRGGPQLSLGPDVPGSVEMMLGERGPVLLPMPTVRDPGQVRSRPAPMTGLNWLLGSAGAVRPSSLSGVAHGGGLDHQDTFNYLDRVLHTDWNSSCANSLSSEETNIVSVERADDGVITEYDDIMPTDDVSAEERDGARALPSGGQVPFMLAAARAGHRLHQQHQQCAQLLQQQDESSISSGRESVDK